MATSHIFGFPRIGPNREMKWALEDYWNGKIDVKGLEEVGKQIRKTNWDLQSSAGIEWLSVGDFSWYDHVLDLSALFGVVPERFQFSGSKVDLEIYFCMARGRSPSGKEAQACEMTKWFDTNYHYIVPEFSPQQKFTLSHNQLFDQIAEAQSLGYKVKPVLIGPLTYLWLGKTKNERFERLELLPALVEAYKQLLTRLEQLGILWIQLDEPILGLDLPQTWKESFKGTYKAFQNQNIQIMFATYFGGIRDNLEILKSLPVSGIHIDATRAGEELYPIASHLTNNQVLSVGIVDGRNIWRTDLDSALFRLKPLKLTLGERLWISSSCSLIHCPMDITLETSIDSEIKSWMAFAIQKVHEIALLTQGVNQGQEAISAALEEDRKVQKQRRESSKISLPEIKERAKSITEAMMRRNSPYQLRHQIQKKALDLPILPTTTIGSFPQTKELRSLHSDFHNGKIGFASYQEKIHEQIHQIISIQEEIGLDVLVHGEVERADMVEYFAPMLEGFAMTQNGWVQSYGSRCVKPPIIYGDIRRPKAMTVDWIKYAQSLTKRPVKAMLTGPITMIRWSFIRNDQSQFETVRQMALAIRDEVQDLENAGIHIIQIDEPAFREGLPMHMLKWKEYLIQAIASFRIASSGVSDQTQIHTHMCYSEFNDIILAIAELDADVIFIEAARSDMELLQAFETYRYPNAIGPGVYDIHSPRIPSLDEIYTRITKELSVIPIEKLWVNPDCGLKTRSWSEVKPSLKNMVDAAKQIRQQHEGQ